MSGMRVDPEELRGAASTIRGGWTPPKNPANSFIGAAMSIAPTETSGALRAAGAAIASALSVLDGRREQFAHVLDVSASRYVDTDEMAAARLHAIGSLNDAPRST
ncbi:hypothetical protein GOARA_049_00040 [Gordonia araii NBRC 100433]|uniref:Uncharacterized protein n=1 Tax=Gordonia araii NBRC 100433 TaxID=1073574 RepID=G7H263_9ACTN|nr:hypothetical protein [Gordonia araii]NNG96592.1 hypothetical protein [Gordonia araii NBRC 100433]GAB09938.1 hypothetical protein GOARA_049_00040 [Gordonia araii NBRC 100433]